MLRFAVVAIAVFGVLRIMHVAAPLLFPESRRGEVHLVDLIGVASQAGFPAIVPAYRPAMLGERPVDITVSFGTRTVVTIAWRQDGNMLTVVQRRGAIAPPPLSRRWGDLQDAVWWDANDRRHALVHRDGFSIAIETTLELRDLRRMVDTLTAWR
jgi:hypothetical protein